MIDWKDPKSSVSKYFNVCELIWLPTWKRLAVESDGLDEHVKAQLLVFAIQMDTVRDFLGSPILVHCWYRPPAYNAQIGGAKYSAHMAQGPWAAVDFHVDGFGSLAGCAEMRAKILPMLDSWGFRMEDIVGDWVHLDSKPTGNGLPRFFRP